MLLPLTFFYQFFHSFKYLFLPGEFQIYIIRIGSSPEYHACNAICLCNSSPECHTSTSNSIWLKPKPSSFILDALHNWNGSGLPLGNIFVYHWPLLHAFPTYLFYVLIYKFSGERVLTCSFLYPQHLASAIIISEEMK